MLYKAVRSSDLYSANVPQIISSANGRRRMHFNISATHGKVLILVLINILNMDIDLCCVDRLHLNTDHENKKERTIITTKAGILNPRTLSMSNNEPKSSRSFGNS